MRRRSLVLASCVAWAALLLAPQLLRAESTEEPATPAVQAASKANLLLAYSSGGTDGPAAITLRLFSPQARRTAGPIELELPKGTWHRVQFDVTSPDGEVTRLSWRQTRLRRFPTATSIRFDAKTTLEAIYRLDPNAVPPPGSQIQATLTLEELSLPSNRVTVGEPPQTARESLLRSTRVALRLRDFEHALELTQRLTEAEPQTPDGYWLRGLALEGLYRWEPALEAYRACRERLSRQERLASGAEHPVGVDRRIDRLQRIVNRQD